MAGPKFRPYRGADATIKGIPYSEGYVYFATDTGRIYLDYNNERLSMGGNGASVFYANDTDVQPNLFDHYYIDISSFADPNASVKPDDLIINSDGSFYRVIEVNLDNGTVECNRIAVSGTGGGGGGGGSGDGGGGSMSYITFQEITSVPYTFIYGQSYEVRYKATAEFDSRININVQIDGLNNQSKNFNQLVTSGEEFTLDLGSQLFQGTNKIVITAITDNSGTAEKRYTGRSAIILALEKDEGFNPRIVQTGNLVFSCRPIGTINKTLQVYVDNTIAVEEEIKATTSNSNVTVTVPKQSHGSHTIKAIITAETSGVTVTTDPIVYQVAWAEEGNTAPLIWFPNEYPAEIVQYEDLIVEYMVWDPEKVTEIETHFYKDGIELANSPRNLNYTSTTVQRWNITDYSVGNNNYTIRVGSTSKPINVFVKEDTERDLSIRTGGLILNLDSSGRSNEENISSKTSWISKGTEKATAVTFNNFNWYNNGWIDDDDGRSCLRVSNGASISIPISGLNILNTDTIESALAFEFRFKVRNVQEYSTLVTTESYEDEKGNLIITKTVSTDKGVLGSIYSNLGFCLGTQEAFFKSSNTIVNARYREDEIINLTFVVDNNSSNLPMIYIYLQGILSGVAKYDKNSDNFNAGVAALEFNSTYCDVDLYNIRIYKGTKLESMDVVHNYISDRKDVKAYDANLITTSTNNIPTIDFNKMIEYNNSHPDETILPYMILDAHGELLPFVKGGKKAVDVEFHNPALDYAYEKGLITDDQYLRGAPSFTYTSGKKSLDVQGTSSQGYPRRNYKWKAKQEDAKWRYTGGPLKDEPIYEYNAEKDKYEGSKLGEVSYKKYYLDSTIGESTFCFKADYMESSSTHNTGYASYVSTLYSKHPLQDYYPNAVLPSSIRTTIYGFPMLIFNKTGANSYEFVGRYNFNLDKGATDSCGFTYDAKSYVRGEDGEFLPMEEVAECWEICNNQGQRTSFTKVDFEETTDAYSEIELNSNTFIPNVYYIKVVNATAATESYVLATEYNANDIYYTKASGVLSVLEDFEYRYSFYEDEIDHAIEGTDEFASASQAVRNAAILNRMRNFRDMAIWLESTDVQDDKKLGSLLGNYTEVTLTADTFEPTVHYIWNVEGRKWDATKVGDEFDITAKYATVEPTPVEYEGVTYQYDTKDYRLKKFSSEFGEHFDQEYCRIYFIMTELLHLYDSRGKNCMMATWGPKVEGGNYIWYPIFYDIDTQLGINNSGVPSWEYDVNPTDEDFFSTSNSVLWKNLWSTMSSDILNRYVELRKDNLTIDAMDGYYNSHPILGRGDIDSWKDILNDEETEQLQGKIISYAKIGKRPAMIYNVDQYYKYIAPAASGYINTSGQTATTETFFYCLQGTRELMRYLYLRNRLNFVDSKWHGGSYAKEAALGELKARYNANYMSETSDKYLMTNDPEKHGTVEPRYDNTGKYLGDFVLWDWANHGPHPLDCTVEFDGMRSYLKQYMSMQLDEVILAPTYCDGINPIALATTEDIKNSIKSTPGFSEQLFYLGGGEYIADLGDLGLKYLNEFAIPTLKRLKRLQLGSDVEGYSNARLNSSNLNLGANALTGEGTRNVNAKTLLEEVILTGLTSLSGQIDMTGSEKLKTFRALNTIISGVSLAQGVQIETLHLPNTITNIQLVEPVALTGILTSPKDAEGKFNKGLFIEGITNATDYSKSISVITYDIIGGNLGYDSYKLLNTLVNFKLAIQERNEANVSKELAINLKEVNWSPYSVVEYGETWDENKASLYFRDNSRFQLEPYIYEETTWEAGTKNGKIYLIDNDYFADNANIITDLNIFDTFINTYNAAVEYYNNNDQSMLKNYFKSTVPNQTYPTVPEITGMIYVNNETAVDEAEITNKYNALFPKIQFFFKNVSKAYMATYVTSIDGIEEIIYTERKPANSVDLSLTYPDPKKYTPTRLNWDFIGWSLNKDANPTDEGIYNPELMGDTFETEWAKLKYTSTDSIIKFYAIFDRTSYPVIFMNYYQDGTEEEIHTEYVVAGENLYDPMILPSTDESALDDEMRYTHIGWVVDKQYCFPADRVEGEKHLVNLSSVVSENMGRTYYACYIQESVFASPTNPELFSYQEMDYKDPYDETYNISGWKIGTTQASYGDGLSGKITIPGEYQGRPVIAFSINGSYNVSHVFFEKPENIRTMTNCNANGFKKFQWPSGLRLIESSLGWNNLIFEEDNFLHKTKVASIGTNAFSGSFDYTVQPITTLRLPGSLITMNDGAFRNLGESGDIPGNTFWVEEVIFGGPGDPSKLNMTELGNSTFAQNDTRRPYPGSTASHVINKFTFYKDASSSTLTVDEFKEFVLGPKVLDGDICDQFEVIETDAAQ